MAGETSLLVEPATLLGRGWLDPTPIGDIESH
jgi:hypothetical protein